MTDTTSTSTHTLDQELAERHAWLLQRGARVSAWVASENARTDEHLHALPFREVYQASLRNILSVEDLGLPQQAGGKTFQLRRLPGEAQHSLWVTDELGERILVSSDELDSDTDSIAAFSPTPDGAYVIWTQSEGGEDWQLGKIRDVSTGEDLSEQLTGMKWPDFAWLDDRTCAFMVWGRPPAGEELTALNSRPSITLHRIGTEQSDDCTIFEPSETEWVLPAVSSDKKWLLVQRLKGIVAATVYRRPLPYSEIDEWETVIDDEGPDHLLGVFDDETYVLSFRHHSSGQILALSRSEERVVYEAPEDEPLDEGELAGQYCIVSAHSLEGSLVRVINLSTGEVIQQLDLPQHLVLHRIATFEDTTLLLHLEVVGGSQSIAEVPIAGASTASLDTDAPYHVETVWATSEDGTRVPMRIVRAHGTPPQGDARVFLSVYGGYTVPFVARGYSSWHAAWLEQGGVLAYAGVRGGGELGEAWHQAARKERKRDGIQDLIACARWFETESWALPRSVAINGMSNGGLMTAAALVAEPTLFGAVITEVPVIDMLNFHRYTAAHGWIAEYGDPDTEDREYLRAYSPLHNVHHDQEYAPTLVLTADRDDRVPPAPHAYPFAIELRNTVRGERSYLKVTYDAGHASGRSLHDAIDERSAVLAFAQWGIETSYQ